MFGVVYMLVHGLYGIGSTVNEAHYLMMQAIQNSALPASVKGQHMTDLVTIAQALTAKLH